MRRRCNPLAVTQLYNTGVCGHAHWSIGQDRTGKRQGTSVQMNITVVIFVCIGNDDEYDETVEFFHSPNCGMRPAIPDRCLLELRMLWFARQAAGPMRVGEPVELDY